MMSLQLALLSWIWLAASLATASPNLILNPSFEDSSSFKPYWSATSVGSGTTIDTNTGSNAHLLASDGGNNAIVYPGNAISQKLQSVAGATYRLSFDAFALWQMLGAPNQPNLQVAFLPSGTPGWDASDPSALYLTVSNGTDGGGPYSRYSFNFTGQGNDIVSFAFASDVTSSNQFKTCLRLDNLSLFQIADPPTASHSSAEVPRQVQTQSSGLIAACVVLGVIAFIEALVGAAFLFRKRLWSGSKLYQDPEKRASIEGLGFHKTPTPIDKFLRAGSVNWTVLKPAPLQQKFGAGEPPPLVAVPELMHEPSSSHSHGHNASISSSWSKGYDLSMYSPPVP